MEAEEEQRHRRFFEYRFNPLFASHNGDADGCAAAAGSLSSSTSSSSSSSSSEALHESLRVLSEREHEHAVDVAEAVVRVGELQASLQASQDRQHDAANALAAANALTNELARELEEARRRLAERPEVGLCQDDPHDGQARPVCPRPPG